MHRLVQLPRHLRNAHRRAEAIEVLIVMPHDVDFIGSLHDLANRMGNHTCLDARMLLHRLGTPSEELRLSADLHRYLIAAASQGKIQPCLRL